MSKQLKPEVVNWGAKEWLSILASILTGKIRQGRNTLNLLKYLKQQYPQSGVFLLNSARAGLILSLQVFKEIKPFKNEVIIPEFICNSVPDAIKKCGLTPVYAPVSKDLNLDVNSLDQICNDKTLAVILPHMYAKPANIKQAAALLLQKDIFLVDDAAQVTGIYVEGEPLGSFGDVGLLSFAQAKTIVTGVRASGGVLFVNNKALEQKLAKIIGDLPVSSGRFTALMHFLLSYKWQGVGQKIDYYFHRLKVKMLGEQKVDHYSPITKISNLDAGIALEQFASLSQRIEQNKCNVQQYRNETTLATQLSFPQLEANNLYLTRMIVQTKELSPKELALKLLGENIVTKYVYGIGSKPYDGSFTSGLLELPLQNITNKQVEKIAQNLT